MDEFDISDYLVTGENTVEITIANNLRNLLGPHHLEEGESYNVRPSSFISGYSKLWSWNKNEYLEWNDGYCFIETSIK